MVTFNQAKLNFTQDREYFTTENLLGDRKDLSDNYNQVRRIAEAEERKLDKPAVPETT